MKSVSRIVIVLGFVAMLVIAGAVKAEDKEKRFVTSLTVYPVTMMGDQHRNVGEVVALMLEKNGFRKLEMAKDAFKPGDKSNLDQVVESFGSLVKKSKIQTDYALYCEILGSRAEGIKELRSVIVDREGKTVWTESQSDKDPAFRKRKPGNPMDCCVFMTERIEPMLILAPMSERGKEGAMERLWAAKSGVPAKEEYEAMEARASKMKESGAKATVVVFPLRNGKKTDLEGAKSLVARLEAEKIFKARVAEEPLWFDIKPNSNEQRVLWDMAKAFQDHVRKNAPDADYALYGDYMISPAGDRVGCVHFSICDRKGDWVIVDFQNNHHPDFQSVDPKSLEDCNRLVVKRLTGYLR